ncbi:MAG: ComF family protein [Dokdonella sp.]|nr:MAG: ComF family protein [Gammaproteobacteria bacterium]TXI76621.1 MAG: ComF family protein [Dokdonella sp.]
MEWRGKVDSLLGVALPAHCLLCAAPALGTLDLCAACLADLPRNHACCRRCALPLGQSAELCGECLKREPPFASAWAPFRYAHPLNLLEARFKFQRDLAAGRLLARLMVDAATASMPPLPAALLCVPLHESRLRERGYNQALELAKPLARGLHLPLLPNSLHRVRSTQAQSGLDARARRRNLRGAFELDADARLPDHVALLDDVMTTGSTLRECARVLRKAGVQRVDVWALARAPARR